MYMKNETSILRLADNATIPTDPANRDYAAYLDWLSAGNTPELPPAPSDIDYVAAVQGLLDGAVQQRNYDNILSACSYADSSAPRFKAEGQACLAWRDAVWVAFYDKLAALQAGTLMRPSIADFIASLPALNWP